MNPTHVSFFQSRSAEEFCAGSGKVMQVFACCCMSMLHVFSCWHMQTLRVHAHVVKPPRRYVLTYECQVSTSATWCEAESASFVKCAPSWYVPSAASNSVAGSCKSCACQLVPMVLGMNMSIIFHACCAIIAEHMELQLAGSCVQL